MFDINKTPIVRNEALEARRYGNIAYAKDLLDTSPDIIKKIYTKIIPINVTYDFAREIFEVICLCDNFDPVDIGYPIPYYNVIIQQQKRSSGSGRAYYINFEKIEQ